MPDNGPGVDAGERIGVVPPTVDTRTRMERRYDAKEANRFHITTPMILVGAVFLITLLIALAFILDGTHAANSGGASANKTNETTPTASSNETTGEAVVKNVEIPGFTDGKATSATWAKVRKNANAQASSDRPAMWKAIYYENRDHFRNVEEAMMAVDWQVEREDKGYRYLVAISKSDGDKNKIPATSHNVPVWNTGPINHGKDYQRIKYTLTAGMFYLQWDPANPYYHGKVMEGDGMKGNCLNVITHRKTSKVAICEVKKPPCPPPHKKPPTKKASCDPAWNDPKNKTYQNPKSPGPTPGASTTDHEDAVATRGTGEGTSGMPATGDPAVDEGSSGTQVARPPTGEVDPGPDGNEDTNIGDPGEPPN